MNTEILTAIAIVIFVSTINSSHQSVADLHKPVEAGLGCNMRLYTYRITQSDSKGRECWDHVSVWSCFGRCDSNEISDWKFPYKRSYHPVCMHAGRSKAVAMLRNCHPQATPETRRYEYMEAMGCHCQTCSTTDTSCEAPNNFRDETSIKVLALAGPSPEDLDY
ncbi:Thyrostimulin beta-5 subunit [Pseudolycoriella hygida]|uniref:Thyrostimulin beta-5 subunit n=1 Tax=Pseudolycoriella hygida TaxID=35572 RepID=A0A9Q0NA09_9DIPT|nr:Thyrostimulin beta-5 subunit [Pseudolycoriella hygida]